MDSEQIMNAWFEEAFELNEATLAEFDKYVEEFCVVKDAQVKKEKELTELNKKLQKMQIKLISFLEEQGKTSHVTRIGTIGVVTRTQWKAPEGEGREDVLEYLRKSGKYDVVMTFNANKFSSWFSAEKNSNENFDLKGVEQKVTKYITVRR